MANADKGKRKGLINEFLSLFNKEIDNLAERLAKAVPADSWVRTELFERILGPIGAWIESRSDSTQSPFLGAAMEKFSDLIEAFGHSLGKGKTGKPAPADAVSARDWVESFKKAAYERLHKAQDPAAEFEKLRKEFELRIALLKFIDEKLKSEAPQEPSTSTQPHKPLITREDLEKFKENFLRVVEGGRKTINGLAKATTPHVRKFADWLEEKGGVKA